MQKAVILIIVVSFFFLFSCTTKEDSPQYIYIEPEPEPKPEPDPYRIEPDEPENIREVEVTSDIITIAWDEVYNAKSYIVYMDDEGWHWREEDYQYSYRVNETTFTITLLQSKQAYYFEVYSSNYGGESWQGAGIACTRRSLWDC
jgi:hypothetical protein